MSILMVDFVLPESFTHNAVRDSVPKPNEADSQPHDDTPPTSTITTANNRH